MARPARHGSSESALTTLMWLLITGAAIAIVILIFSDTSKPDLTVTIIPDIEAGGGEFEVKLVGAGIDKLSTEDEYITVLLEYKVTYTGATPAAIKGVSVAEVAFHNPVLKNKPHPVLVDHINESRLASQGSTAVLEVRLRIPVIPHASIKIGAIDDKTLGYDPLIDKLYEPYKDEPVKITVDVVGIYFED